MTQFIADGDIGGTLITADAERDPQAVPGDIVQMIDDQIKPNQVFNIGDDEPSCYDPAGYPPLTDPALRRNTGKCADAWSGNYILDQSSDDEIERENIANEMHHDHKRKTGRRGNGYRPAHRAERFRR